MPDGCTGNVSYLLKNISQTMQTLHATRNITNTASTSLHNSTTVHVYIHLCSLVTKAAITFKNILFSKHTYTYANYRKQCKATKEEGDQRTRGKRYEDMFTARMQSNTANKEQLEK